MEINYFLHVEINNKKYSSDYGELFSN